jgi:hypothetical protein
MDALDLLKRVFQLKRFMGGDNGGGSEASGSGSGNNAFKMDEGADPDDGLVQAGCTAVVAVKHGNELYVANAGDSRGVLCRGGQAVALSEDHKPAQEGERSRIIAAGGFLSEIGGVCRWGSFLWALGFPLCPMPSWHPLSALAGVQLCCSNTAGDAYIYQVYATLHCLQGERQLEPVSCHW